MCDIVFSGSGVVFERSAVFVSGGVIPILVLRIEVTTCDK